VVESDLCRVSPIQTGVIPETILASLIYIIIHYSAQPTLNITLVAGYANDREIFTHTTIYSYCC